MKNDINTNLSMREKLIKFFSDPNNYSSYEGDLKSTDCLYSAIYNDVPHTTYIIVYDDEKGYYATPYANVRDFKGFPDRQKAVLKEFVATLVKTLEEKHEFVHECTLTTDETFIFSVYGFIRVMAERSTGNVRKISFHPISESDETIANITEIIVNSISTKEDEETEKNHYQIAYADDGEIDTMESQFDDWTTDIKKNYNDDVPYERINEEIRKDKASLIMMHGEPGTGKSSLIKSLINDNLDKEFIYIDSSLLTSISNGQFLSFLNSHRGSIFILEDCEKAIADRKTSANEAINTILNITDGIVAESLKCKFICTFNCQLDDIDKALLRKGRLSVIYEFGKLSLEKTKVIYPEATKPMTLAEAHYALEENNFSAKKQTKIGF